MGNTGGLCAQMLAMVGPGLQAELGWGAFAALYLLSGCAANAASYIGNVSLRRRRLWRTAGASAAVYALLACTALVQPYRRFVWLFGIELNSLGCGPTFPPVTQIPKSVEMYAPSTSTVLPPAWQTACRLEVSQRCTAKP